MLLQNKYNINEFIVLFFNSVLDYLAVTALNQPVLTVGIERNKKIIKSIMCNPRQSADFIYRIKHNLIVLPDGFQREQDFTLYDMFYEMLNLMNKYYFAETDKQQFQVKYDMEQLYYSWCYEISSKDCMEINKYHIKQFLCGTRIKLYNLMHSLIR